MEYNILRPWESLDPWQEEYIKTDPEQDCFVLCGRQSGKTTAMSIKAVELCVKKFHEGQNILICSITEKQAYRMLAKALVYAEMVYPKEVVWKGKDKPTMHKIIFKSGAGIYCYAAGETGEGLRGDTIKKLMIDEGSRMSEEFFLSVTPMLSVSGGSMDIASTPFGTKDREGRETFFFQCSKDENYKKFYISAEDCPRHSKEYLEREKERMTKLQYAQEYLAQFLDEVKAVFSREWIDQVCTLKRRKEILQQKDYYLGGDIAGWGKDKTALEILDGTIRDKIEQVENIILEHKKTTETSKAIINLNLLWRIKNNGIDDGGMGFGVYSELLDSEVTKRKTTPLNNSKRSEEDSRKLLKEEMYQNLLVLGERGKIKLLDDEEIKSSLSSIQHGDGKIFGSDSHVTEGIIRAAWLVKTKGLKLFVHSF